MFSGAIERDHGLRKRNFIWSVDYRLQRRSEDPHKQLKIASLLTIVKVFLKILENPQENICALVFFNKVADLKV